MNPTKMLPSERHGIPLNSISSAILDAERHPTTTKHTPGPWMQGPTANTWHKVYEGKNGEYGGRAICTLNNIHANGARQRGDFETETANARLIASAPDLLAALKSAVSYLEANRPKGKIREIFTQLNEYENGVLKPARAAIAQAEGGSQ